MRKKKKVLFNSNFSKLKTGFGRTAKIFLSYLYENGYEVIEYAAGVTKNNALLHHMPWKAYGSLPDTHDELNEIIRQTNYSPQFLNYGPIYINDVIAREKPDVFIGAEDAWGGFPYYREQGWWNKVPCISWMTLDSLPLDIDTVKNLDKYEHLFVKATFAQRELEKLGKKAHWVPDFIDHREFYPMQDEKRFELRRSLGIDDDTLVFGFVFKNQLRKLVLSLLEGFSLFKRKYPHVKTKLLLYTDFDAQSWRIAEGIQEFGLKNEDVLSCYLCRDCKHFSVEPHRRGLPNEHECPRCHSQGFYQPNGHDHGISEDEMNNIYNLFDGYFHPHTSGGFEMPILEAIYAGVPVATTGYSSGEMYTESGFVENIEFTTYREVNSNFIKAHALPESIAEKMEKFYVMGKDGRKDYAKRARNWALKNFDVIKHCEWFADYIDKLPAPDYSSYTGKINLQFGLPVVENDEEFVEKLHEGIWGKKITLGEKQELLKFLNQRHEKHPRIATYEVVLNAAQRFLKSQEIPTPESFIKKSDKKKLVYLLHGKEKEAIAILPVLFSLKHEYKDWDIYVSAEPGAANIVMELGVNLLPYTKNKEFWKNVADKILEND